MNTISAVITTFKRPEILPRAIESVLSQTSQPNELIVVDNHGDLKTREIVNSYLTTAKLPVIYYHEEKRGVSHARNRGIDLAKNEYIAFLDDDDVWLPHHLANFHGIISNNPDCTLFGGLRARFGKEDKLILPNNDSLLRDYNDKEDVLIRTKKIVHRPFYTPSMSESIIKTTAARQILFDTELIGREDIYFVWQVGEIGDIIIEKKVHGLADQLDFSLFSTSEDASSAEKLEMNLKKCTYGIKMLEKWNNRSDKHISSRMRSELGNAYFDSAYYHEIAGNRKTAISHLAKAMSNNVKAKHIKLITKILAYSILNRY